MKTRIILSLMLVAACSEDSKIPLGSQPTPVLREVTPSEGAVGDTVTLLGTHLGNDPAKGMVVFGDFPALEVTEWSDTQIVATVPEKAENGVAVVVNGKTSNQLAFKILPTDSAGGDNTTQDTGDNGNIPGGGNSPGNNDATGVLTGTVTDSFGFPATYARVIVSSDAAFSAGIHYATAGTDGSFSLSLLPGDYYVKASLDSNADTVFFEIGLDSIGWDGPFAVNENQTRLGANVALSPAATGTIRGALTDADASWGASAAAIVSMDRGAGTIRSTAPVTTAGAYILAEVPGDNVGVVAFRDLNSNGRFDFNFEPADTLNGNVAANATAIDGVFPSKRTVSGIVTNGEGWTIYLEDRNNNDPSGNRWHVGTQVVGADGSFEIEALPTTYRLRAFVDTNGNGIVDANENRITLQGDFSTGAGNPAPLSLIIPPDVVFVSSRVIHDADADGQLAPGEAGTIEVSLQNLGGKLLGIGVSASAIDNVTLRAQPAVTGSGDFGQTLTATIEVTAAVLAPGSQIELDLTLTGDNGYGQTWSIYAGIFSGDPYLVQNYPYFFTDIAATGIRLWNAESEQNSEQIDFRAGGGMVTGSDFAFPFYGSWVTDGNAIAFGQGMMDGIEVGDNGYISFVNAADRRPLAVPSSDGDTQMVLAPLWSDFVPGQVFADISGTAPTRLLTVQWSGLMRAGADGVSNFQVRLHETSGIIDVAYEAATLVSGDVIGINFGDGTTFSRWEIPTANGAVRLLPNGW